MIRYVVAVLLAIAILSLAGLAINDGASETTERELQTEIAALEAAAVDLEETEELSPAGHPNPQRVVELSIPSRSLTREGVSHLEFEPVDDADASIARYVLDDGTRGRELVATRIVYRDPADNRTTELGGTGTQRLRLVLLPDETGRPVVVAEPPDSSGRPSDSNGRLPDSVGRPSDSNGRLSDSRAKPSLTADHSATSRSTDAVV